MVSIVDTYRGYSVRLRGTDVNPQETIRMQNVNNSLKLARRTTQKEDSNSSKSLVLLKLS